MGDKNRGVNDRSVEFFKKMNQKLNQQFNNIVLIAEDSSDYPGVTKEGNVNKIAENLQKGTNRASILAQLRERKPEARQQEPVNKPETRKAHKPESQIE